MRHVRFLAAFLFAIAKGLPKQRGKGMWIKPYEAAGHMAIVFVVPIRHDRSDQSPRRSELRLAGSKDSVIVRRKPSVEANSTCSIRSQSVALS
jgi:hypothetical protein